MSNKLTELLVSSGQAGTTGQSLKNHAAPQGGIPASGDSQKEYQCLSWTWSTTGAPLPLNEQTGYASGTVFNMTFTIDDQPLASHIRRTGTNVITIASSGGGNGSSQSQTHSVTTSTSGSLSLTMTSRFNPTGGMAVSSVMFVGATDYPDEFTAPDGPNSIRFTASADGVAGSGQETRTITFTYVVDIGGFNQQLTKAYDIKMNDRGSATADFTKEWSSTGTETTGVGDLGTGDSCTKAQATQGDDPVVYLRYKLTGAGSWDGGDANGWRIQQYFDDRVDA